MEKEQFKNYKNRYEGDGVNVTENTSPVSHWKSPC